MVLQVQEQDSVHKLCVGRMLGALVRWAEVTVKVRKHCCISLFPPPPNFPLINGVPMQSVLSYL